MASTCGPILFCDALLLFLRDALVDQRGIKVGHIAGKGHSLRKTLDSEKIIFLLKELHSLRRIFEGTPVNAERALAFIALKL